MTFYMYISIKTKSYTFLPNTLYIKSKIKTMYSRSFFCKMTKET